MDEAASGEGQTGITGRTTRRSGAFLGKALVVLVLMPVAIFGAAYVALLALYLPREVRAGSLGGTDAVAIAALLATGVAVGTMGAVLGVRLARTWGWTGSRSARSLAAAAVVVVSLATSAAMTDRAVRAADPNLASCISGNGCDR